jgi:hypothetical protein
MLQQVYIPHIPHLRGTEPIARFIVVCAMLAFVLLGRCQPGKEPNAVIDGLALASG